MRTKAFLIPPEFSGDTRTASSTATGALPSVNWTTVGLVTTSSRSATSFVTVTVTEAKAMPPRVSVTAYRNVSVPAKFAAGV
jgi:hypothetical protein